MTDRSRVTAAVAEALLWHGRDRRPGQQRRAGLLGAAEETTDAELRDLMELHFFGPAALTRAVLPHMRERGSGAIVQMSSMGGRMSFPGRRRLLGHQVRAGGLVGGAARRGRAVRREGADRRARAPSAPRSPGPAALRHSPRLPAYDAITGPLRENLPATDGAQPGDPAKAAAAILLALDAPQTPLRLALGDDAADNILGSYARSQAEALTWEKASRRTDFDSEQPRRPAPRPRRRSG